jgi:hypothetical protein
MASEAVAAHGWPAPSEKDPEEAVLRVKPRVEEQG